MKRIFSPRLSEFIYTVLLRPKPLRKIANRCLLRIIPEKVSIDNLDLYLNPNDPVLSPAVTLGLYEPWEREMFRELCKPGFTVVDLGANVGLYTITAANAVGRSGSVIAVEPHLESFLFLQKTIEANRLTQVKAFNVACGNVSGTVNLYHAPDNRADSRIYDPTGSREKAQVGMVMLDELLEREGVKHVDIIKMDIQGAEGLALEGMIRTLQANPGIILVCEYWPWGIRAAGVSPRAFLERLAALDFTLQSIDESSRTLKPVENIAELLEEAATSEYTSRTLQRSHYNFLCRRADRCRQAKTTDRQPSSPHVSVSLLE